MMKKIRLQDLREEKELTQKEVAAFLYCDQSLYSKYERLERDIPVHLLTKLADYYETNLDYILKRTDIRKMFPVNKDKESYYDKKNIRTH
ncbi:helix-turn-helix domain-containing protein [Paenibacillus solani]|uniref:helix-turn-helix domain-containing protein n=1 Tax=Paenibacillus solani TaxID=1705565 RepID=UPI003D28BA6E